MSVFGCRWRAPPALKRPPLNCSSLFKLASVFFPVANSHRFPPRCRNHLLEGDWDLKKHLPHYKQAIYLKACRYRLSDSLLPNLFRYHPFWRGSRFLIHYSPAKENSVIYSISYFECFPSLHVYTLHRPPIKHTHSLMGNIVTPVTSHFGAH